MSAVYVLTLKFVCLFSFQLSIGILDYHKKEIASCEHYRLIKTVQKQAKFILFVSLSNSFVVPELVTLMSFFWRLLK